MLNKTEISNPHLKIYFCKFVDFSLSFNLILSLKITSFYVNSIYYYSIIYPSVVEKSLFLSHFFAFFFIRVFYKYFMYFRISSAIDSLFSVDDFNVFDCIMPCTIGFLIKIIFKLLSIFTVSKISKYCTLTYCFNDFFISQIETICIWSFTIFHLNNYNIFVFRIKIQLMILNRFNKFRHKWNICIWSRNIGLNSSFKY